MAAATDRYIHLPSALIDDFISTCLIGAVVLAAYPIVLYAFKVVGKEDWEAMPASLRRIAGKLVRRRVRG